MSILPATKKRRLLEVTGTSSEMSALEAVLQEMREMRREQARRDEDLAATLRLRDEELARLREQLSRSDNIAFAGQATGDGDVCKYADGSDAHAARAVLGYKLKPDSFDGSVPLREFFSQFELIARANHWNETAKTIALASCLKGGARSVLESIKDLERMSYSELKSKLELRFREGHLFRNFLAQFSSRKQKFGEDLAALGSDLERLSRLAFPECPFKVRDEFACTQFVSALTNDFVRRTLQLEGVSSLREAVERAKAIKLIQEEDFERKKEGSFGNRFGKDFGKVGRKEIPSKGNGKAEESRKENVRKGNGFGRKVRFGPRECWSCGKTGHFRSE